MHDLTIRPMIDADRPWVTTFLAEEWGATAQAVRGGLFYPHELPGLLAERTGQIVGIAIYRQLDPSTWELATLNSLEAGAGIGTMLVQAVAAVARAQGATQLVVVTTNDNLHALRFYQRRGFVLHAVRIGAVNQSRRDLKPEIPLVGNDQIPIRDELELALALPAEPTP